ncbi:phosphate ABC transporter substrate-binding protein PstS [Thiorhodovibrio frisius]|uniref:Phosphate-binding protein PstS n=1 Tax=Thiorhodovibrio frisius TaxID=631362 RepID=H8YXT8_9GAMM|nr:phosphate ABC transporter substrate-binding protein PstS [Thiorhodovibrio frisius]EIC23264.1 phosphate ABC transporter, phosphate-binding protein [Thiorhodovibrio frisius]WPL23660.1 Phosphate-binding protein PstS precursor [Thiorhodovibrio frisius]
MKRMPYLPAALLLGASLSGCGPSGPADDAPSAAPDTTPASALTAAGSSFAAPLMSQWMKTYGEQHPDLALSYASVGSGEGIKRFIAGEVAIGTTDAPLKPEEAAQVQGAFAQIPITGGMIALAYNLPGVAGPLNLPRAVYADIFLNKIHRWDDPRIQAANPGLELPSKLIQVVARRDSSGTTFAFTNHLASISPEWAAKYSAGKQIGWPEGTILASGNEGVAQRIKITHGAIGYVEAGFASRLHLPLAWLENRSGGLIAPTAETGQRALVDGSDAMPDNLTVTVPDPAGARSYLIVTLTWALVRAAYPEPFKTRAVHEFLHWILTEGQEQADGLGFVPLPTTLSKASLLELDRLGGTDR